MFEVDEPRTQAWKQRGLVELGYGVPSFLRLVPVDFERGDAWLERLAAAGFDAKQPAVVSSLGVSMSLSREAVESTLREVTSLAAGSTFVMSFMLPIELAEPEMRKGVEAAARGARERPAVAELLPAGRDARAGSRGGLPHRRARLGRRAHRALLLGAKRRVAGAEQLGGAARRVDVAARSPRALVAAGGAPRG